MTIGWDEIALPLVHGQIYLGDLGPDPQESMRICYSVASLRIEQREGTLFRVKKAIAGRGPVATSILIRLTPACTGSAGRHPWV